MVAKEITLKDIGRPKNLRIPLPEDGGIVVLTGRNGAGKSTTLEAIQDAVTGRKDKKSKPRDGVTSGRLNGCGITMTVSRKITRTGELTVETLDGGRLSIADLVSPPFKGEVEADGRRIKALVQLAGVVADFSLFKNLHRFADQIVSVEAQGADDILVMADKTKRDFEQEARNAEGRRDIEKQHALACEEAAAGIDVEVEADSAKLQARLESAVRRGQELISAAQTAKQRNTEILQAREKISAAKASGATSLQDAKRAEELAAGEHDAATRRVLAAEDELRRSREALRAATDKWDAAKTSLGQAEHFHEAIAEWEQTVGKGEMPVPSDEELNAADAEVTAAREAIEAGATARAAKEKLAKADEHSNKMTRAEQEALELREAAAGIDRVLTEQIAKLGCPLRVEAGRLVTDTDRGATFYAELSEGERWRMAVEIAIKAVGKGGLLTIPQEAYQGLQHSVRVDLHNLAKASSVVIVTAQCSDDPEIEVEAFEDTEGVEAVATA